LLHWPAMEKWSIQKLEERFRHVGFKVGSDKKGRKLRLKMKYFADYMKQQQDDSPLYLFETGMGSNADMAKLKEDYAVPDIFPHDWFSLVNQESRPPYQWWCIGPRRSGTTVHTDPMGTSAWNAVTTGVKRWVLFEPDTPKRVAKGKDLIKKARMMRPSCILTSSYRESKKPIQTCECMKVCRIQAMSFLYLASGGMVC